MKTIYKVKTVNGNDILKNEKKCFGIKQLNKREREREIECVCL